MIVIGVTGRTCAGKDSVTQALRAKGAVVIDVDALGHEALEANKNAVIQAFGQKILDESGKIDRKTLGRIVFSSPGKLKELEGINHPWMKAACREEIERMRKSGERIVVLNAALLHRMGLDALCSHVVFVRAFFCVRAYRAWKRDGLSLRRFLQRDKAQKDISPRCIHEDAEIHIISNTCGKGRINRQIRALCARIISGTVAH
ncbi:dephospho-CoA kinase [Parasphaerochaeta coccoides]|uniref:Dephospho-CoA kinase n=1 Tax=Parasphaerochaeta coccoides (strain ATCC BAA-1237 / DSM 17374 / SPN1) TaxID=760011 RepID=F4GHG0_PARC1|nr:dephospho-CoA kinase [Parasphaerochaeta coccoides]AEC02549.1 Dephospho-CoA kinase [Parasphaerochaeta coccoides DSM 17374]